MNLLNDAVSRAFRSPAITTGTTRFIALALCLGATATVLAQPSGVTVLPLGNFANASNVVQLPTAAISAANPVVWYSLTLPRVVDPHRYLDISTSGAGFTDTEIALFAADGTLIATDDDDGANNFSALSFGITNAGLAGRPAPIAEAGQSAGVPNDGRDGALSGNPQVGTLGTAAVYYIAVTDFNALFANNFSVMRGDAVPIPTYTTLVTIRLGTPSGQVAPTVSAGGSQALIGQTFVGVTASTFGNVTSVVADLSPFGGSSSVPLTFNSDAGFWSGEGTVSPLNQPGSFPFIVRASNAIGDVAVSQGEVPVRQSALTCTFALERVISSTPGTAVYTYSTTAGNVDGPWTNACFVSTPSGNDVWFRFTPTQNGILTLSTCNSDTGVVGDQPDTLLGIRTTCNTAFITCGDDVGGCGLGTRLPNIQVTAGQEYNIAVRAFSGDIANGKLAATFTPTQDAAPAGGGQSFDNRQQSIALSFVTRRFGIVGLGVPVRIFAYPRSYITSNLTGDWVQLDGQTLPTNTNTALFAEVGTNFGGSQTTFNLPDARERVLVANGTAPDRDFLIGQTFGSVQSTLTTANLPPHTHTMPGALPPTGSTGGGIAFDNTQPSLVLPISVATQGFFPSPNGSGGGAAHSEPYVGQVLLTCAVPSNATQYQRAAGASLPIATNPALFSLFGTQFGGNGSTTFNLPDLRGTTPMFAPVGSTSTGVGTVVGARNQTLAIANLPAHTHATPAGNTGAVGGNAPFDNRQTGLGLQFAIATVGNFPAASGMNDSTPYLGEIIMFGGSFVPGGTLPCDGRLLPISQNPALFSLIGTTFGGNGTTNFALPDLRNRAIVGSSTNWPVGQVRGANTLTLTTSQMPAHTHTFIPFCDSIDFNNNGVFPEDQDVLDYFTVLAGGTPITCDPALGCGDLDFNNNDVFPEDQDVIDFFTVLAGGDCG